METHRLVLPGDLNQYGNLFGGRLLSWVDEACWIAASLDFPSCRFVTIGMDRVAFHHGIQEGAILSIESQHSRTGNTSVTYEVTVRRGRVKLGPVLFETQVTFVNVDESGEKQPVEN